jgi:hypothetical protein
VKLPMFLLRAFVVWLVLISVETVHRMLRTLLLVPHLGDFPARQVSILTGSLLILGVTLLFVRWIAATIRLQLLGVGMLWIVLTMLFEIGVGRLVLHLSWDRRRPAIYGDLAPSRSEAPQCTSDSTTTSP